MTVSADKQIHSSTRFIDYLKMIKFSHSIFALPFALIGLVEVIYVHGMKWDHNLIYKSVLVLICMVSLRSAAMGFNRLVDRKIDAANPRTSNREIPSGKISSDKAWFFTILFLLIFIIAAWLINPLAGMLAPVAILLVLGYSYTKRFTYLCHFVLGLAIGLAPSAVWIAISGTIEWLPIFWSLGLTFYIAGFDILYSCQDSDFDRKQSLYSIPSRFGISTALIIARLSHLLSILMFIATIWFTAKPVGILYLFGIFITLILFVYEHYLVRGGRLGNIPIAFFNVNAYISTVLFIGVLLNRIFPIITIV